MNMVEILLSVSRHVCIIKLIWAQSRSSKCWLVCINYYRPVIIIPMHVCVCVFSKELTVTYCEIWYTSNYIHALVSSTFTESLTHTHTHARAFNHLLLWCRKWPLSRVVYRYKLSWSLQTQASFFDLQIWIRIVDSCSDWCAHHCSLESLAQL